MNPNRRSLAASLFIGLLLCHLTGLSQDIDFIPVDHAESGSYTVMGITQDPTGYLWLATTDGLYRYDGHQYVSYRHEILNSNSPAAAKIECIAADRDGSIWLSPFCLGVDKLDPATGKFTHFRHRDDDPGSLANDSVWVIMQDREGTVWIGTKDGLDRFDSKTNTFIHHRHNPDDPSSLSWREVKAIYEDHEGTLWIGTGNFSYGPRRVEKGGLNKFNKQTGKFTRYIHDKNDVHSLAENRVRAIFEDSRGNFWVGTCGDGLHTMDKTKGTFERHSHDASNPHKLSRPKLGSQLPNVDDQITFITEDRQGRILIATYQEGITVYDPTTRTTETYGSHENKEKLADTQFWTGYKTSDDIIWMSSWEGNLYKVDPNKKHLPHVRTGGRVHAFEEDDAHTVWYTTFTGLVHVLANGKEERYLINPEDPRSTSNMIFYIQKDGNKFWLTTAHGLYRFDIDTKKFTHYPRIPHNENSPSTDSVITLKLDGNTLWIGSEKGLNGMDTKTGTFRHFRHNPYDTTSINNDLVISITVDRKHYVWVCMDKGVSRLDEKTGRAKSYLKESAVVSMKEDLEGNLWAATEAGLLKYDEKADNFYSFKDEAGIISSDLVIWITEDHEQNLWLLGPKGIVRVNKDRNKAVSYGKNQGVDGSVIISIGVTRSNGEVWVGDTTGYFYFQPNELHQNASAPVAVVSNFLLNNIEVQPSSNGILSEPLTETKAIHLTHNQNDLSFQFVNIDFSSEPEDTRLLYQLQNYDNGWRRAGSERIASYYNLPPGEYIFKVKALNDIGISDERNIAVIITPPWWQTWWAYSFATAMATGLAYGLYRRRSNMIKRKQSAQINIMVTAQEDERKRISRDLHDAVGTKLSALKLSLASLQEKATLTNHEELTTLAESSNVFISEVMHDVRQLLINLSPTVLEEFGYTTAIEGLINRINQSKQTHFKLVVFGMDNPLTKETELGLYRMTQELINNVLKHAEAKNALLQIGQRDEKVILIVEDDGKGFDTNVSKNGGYGLHNLDARAKLMSGTMMIDSQPGKGTSIVIEIPYQRN